MKRFHVHVAVENLDESIRFYSALFGAEPTTARPDYAKWMLEDPRVNFAISHRDRNVGINHIGFQLDTADDLAAIRNQLATADAQLVEQTATACCYSRSDKYWVTDPSGIAWEAFHTLGSVPLYGEDLPNVEAGPCCVPLSKDKAPEQGMCCNPRSLDQHEKSACCA